MFKVTKLDPHPNQQTKQHALSFTSNERGDDHAVARLLLRKSIVGNYFVAEFLDGHLRLRDCDTAVMEPGTVINGLKPFMMSSSERSNSRERVIRAFVTEDFAPWMAALPEGVAVLDPAGMQPQEDERGRYIDFPPFKPTVARHPRHGITENVSNWIKDMLRQRNGRLRSATLIAAGAALGFSSTDIRRVLSVLGYVAPKRRMPRVLYRPEFEKVAITAPDSGTMPVALVKLPEYSARAYIFSPPAELIERLRTESQCTAPYHAELGRADPGFIVSIKPGHMHGGLASVPTNKHEFIWLENRAFDGPLNWFGHSPHAPRTYNYKCLGNGRVHVFPPAPVEVKPAAPADKELLWKEPPANKVAKAVEQARLVGAKSVTVDGITYGLE